MSKDKETKNPPSERPPPSAAEKELQRRSRRSFITALGAAAAGYGGWTWLKTRPEVDGIPGPLRSMLQINESLSERIFDPSRRVKERSASDLTPGGPRANGNIGLDDPVNLETWRLHVAGGKRLFTLDDLKALPEYNQTTPLNCIEGWTTVARWTGVRLVDFTTQFFPEGLRKPFVSLSTPKKDYYVGLDAKSAFHEQTLLCYAINGEPLTSEHGAPLRLLIPTKYGIKNLKRIGEIRFTQDRPSDYWAEQGYDWYAGL